MPFALDEIRKFGRAGHCVFASDTFKEAPGSHSRFVEEAIITPSPHYDPLGFLDAVRGTVATKRVEILVPCFEEVFVLAQCADELGSEVQLFAPPFEVLAMLHDKSTFRTFVEGLGLDVPMSRTVTDKASLGEATREFGEFFARPVYSRGGVSLYTNTGPLAGAVDESECVPTPEAPWIVQEFVHGEDLCSFAVAHGGHVAAHSTYLHPRTIEHAGGIVFESIEAPEALRITQAIAEATGYTGQLSLDFMRSGDRLYLIECNPRPTGGSYVMPDEMFVDAVFNPQGKLRVAPAGLRSKVSMALIRDMVHNWREIPQDLSALFSAAPDVYADPGDIVPALYQFLSLAHVRTYRKALHIHRHKRTDIMAAYFYDVSWDGERLPCATDAPKVTASASPRVSRSQG